MPVKILSLYLRNLLLTVVCLLFAITAMAGIEPYQQKLQGTLKKGDTLIVKDEKFQNSSYNWAQIRNNKVVNVITLGLRSDTVFKKIPTFKCEADLKIEYWSSPDQDLPITLQHVSLKIGYDSVAGSIYQQMDQYRFANAYKIKVTINDISSKELGKLPPLFYLNAEVIVNRDYLPDPKADLVPIVTGASGGATSPKMRTTQLNATTAGAAPAYTVNVVWEGAPSNELYDLEWTFVDETSANGKSLAAAGANPSDALLAGMFRNNSTRISIEGNTYSIPLVQQHQYLLTRIRRVDETKGYRDEGDWVYKLMVNGQKVPAVLTLANGIDWYESGRNWQYSAVYAEDGKRKEVVSFFDGTLRNRQSVTLSSTANKAIVQETIYDAYGRAVANILPAPVNNETLRFYEGVNLGPDGQPYTWQNVLKNETGSCTIKPDPLNTSNGASRYYSANNDITTDPFRKNIPDAEGYPIAVTTYTPDNTGRPSVQGGVGFQLQPDNSNPLTNRSTRLYYGKPEQWELDRIFGNDIGYADHYLKNMTIDPNGQVSVSYQNSNGKVIATALTGSNPDTSLLPLSDRPEPRRIKYRMFTPDRFKFDAQLLKLTATSTYLAAVPYVKDTLELNIPDLIKKYQENNVTICSNCFYELSVQVSDDCGQILVDIKNDEIGSKLPDCGKNGNTQRIINIPVNKIGEYYVTVTLALNPYAIEAFTDDFIKNNTNLKTQFYFVLELLKRENFTKCFSDCSSCKAALGERSDFMQAFKQRMQQNGIDVVANQATIDVWVSAWYDVLYSNCQASRETCTPSPCDRLKGLLMEDVSPGGQFALFDANGNPLEPTINVISNNWRAVFPAMTSGPDYENNKFEVNDGVILTPNSPDFTLQMLVQYWQPQWAEKFINFHPERCAYDFCLGNSQYKKWDQRLTEVYTSIAELPAVLNGVQYSRTDPAWLLAADPYFKPGAPGAAYMGSFQNDLIRYSERVLKISAPLKSISDFVDFSLYCVDITGSINRYQPANTSTAWTQCDPEPSCRIPDLEWQYYLKFYLELKDKYYQQYMDSAFCKGKCRVGTSSAPVPGTELPGADCSGILPSDFRAYYEVINYEGYVTYEYTGNPIKEGVTVKVSVFDNGDYRDEFGTDVMGAEFTHYTPTKLVFNAGRGKHGRIPKVFLETVLQSCTSDPVYVDTCDPLYRNKQSRIGNAALPFAVSTDTMTLKQQVKDSLNKQLNSACSVNVDSFIAKLSHSSTYSGLSTTMRSSLRAGLLEICTKGGDLEHIFGSNTVKPGESTANGDVSMEQVMKRVIGYSVFTLDFNPWLTDAFYAYDKPGQSVAKVTSKTTAAICTKLDALRAEQQVNQPGMSLYNYLVSQYGSAMNLKEADFNALVKSCSNCRYLIDREIKLPVFLDGTAKGCITGIEFNAAMSDLSAAISDFQNTSNPNYNDVVRNYLNQRWGFTLGETEYALYKDQLQTSPNAILCNIPVYDQIDQNPLQCMFNLIDGAVEGGKRQYDQYIDSVRKDFKNRYIAVCSGVKATGDYSTSVQNYHYTLYYYDQAGSLVRTIPPAGVKLIDSPEQLEYIRKARDAGNSCNYNGPMQNTPVSDALLAIGDAVVNNNQALEMWVAGSKDPVHLVTPVGNNKAYFTMAVHNGHMEIAIYRLTSPSPEIEIVNSNIISVAVGTDFALRPFNHIVIQGTNLSDATSPMSVYMNGVLLQEEQNVPGSPLEWEIDGSGTFTTDIAMLRQMRVYNRLLASNEIMANADEMCMGLSPDYESGLRNNLVNWSRINTTDADGLPTQNPDGTVVGYTGGIYPKHNLKTSYAYNSLGGVVRQRTPDAKESKFWYDYTGKLVFSANAEQQREAGRYSYTKYDDLVRIVEVGEKRNAAVLTMPDFLPESTVQQQYGSGTDGQMTTTIYDVPVLNTSLYPQDNLRKRVAASIYRDAAGANPIATYYSYDPLGNVKSLWQQLDGLHEMKRLEYKYDLVSGKVNEVRYQFGKPDQFFYNYSYDADNRLIAATSGIADNGNGWKISTPSNDAQYSYYLHGPLARTLIGSKFVQGIDYAYTLQGWLKYINGVQLDPQKDLGKDGTNGYAPDVMAYSLDYFTGDYKNIGGQKLGINYQHATTDITGQNLYNGNISRTTAALSNINGGMPVGYSYRYDQLNRIRSMRRHPLTNTTSTWGAAQIGTNRNGEDYTYDANGNILTLNRNGNDDNHLAMDRLAYQYERDGEGYLLNNQLQLVHDAVPASTYPSDVDDMTTAFRYDSIGNLIADESNGISEIKWTVYGKIQSISSTNGSLIYKYDAGGNRIYKEFHPASSPSTVQRTWYLRDPQGQVLATYGNTNGDNATYWKEQYLYGSSRLGMWQPDMLVAGGSVGNASSIWGQGNRKRYELSNHLGNVLATIGDEKSGDYATVFNQTDYTPFGAQMDGAVWNLGAGYRYGFNGKENDNEVKGDGNQQDYGMRVYDPRIAKFLSVDPLTQDYPFYTPYQFAGNNPIKYIDLDGGEQLDPISRYLFNNAALTIVKDPTSTKAKALSIGMGVGGSVEKQIGFYINAFRHPINTVKSLGKMLVQTNEERIADYANSITLKYTALGDNNAIYGAGAEATTDIIFGLSSLKAGFKSPTVAEPPAPSEPAGPPPITFEYEGVQHEVQATTPYRRPTNATTNAQRRAVNQPGATCVTCGVSNVRMNADHITPLSIEFLTSGNIDATHMRSLEAVQPQCGNCSNAQGVTLRNITRVVNNQIRLRQSSNPSPSPSPNPPATPTNINQIGQNGSTTP